VTFQKSVRQAYVGASNLPRKHAHLGNPRRPLVTTFRPFIQRHIASDSFVRFGDVAARILMRLEEAQR
jgi:hypothetical protein